MDNTAKCAPRIVESSDDAIYLQGSERHHSISNPAATKARVCLPARQSDGVSARSDPLSIFKPEDEILARIKRAGSASTTETVRLAKADVESMLSLTSLARS